MRGVTTRCQISLQLIVSFEICAPHQNSSMFKYGVVEQFFSVEFLVILLRLLLPLLSHSIQHDGCLDDHIWGLMAGLQGLLAVEVFYWVGASWFQQRTWISGEAPIFHTAWCSCFSNLKKKNIFYKKFAGLRLLAIGRNQYIELMNQCRSSKVSYFCCRYLGVSEVCVSLVGSMTKLTAALMRGDKLSKL